MYMMIYCCPPMMPDTHMLLGRLVCIIRQLLYH
jgi:hypothetical protein